MSYGRPSVDSLSHLLGQTVLASSLASGQGTGKSELGADSVDTVGGVQVLDDDHLVAGGHSLAGGDDGPGEEEFPDL